MIDAAELIAITLHAERTNPDDPDSLPWDATDVEVQGLYLDDARAILVMLAAAGWLNKEGADTLRAEVERLRAEWDAMRPVVDAANGWVEGHRLLRAIKPDLPTSPPTLDLVAAVDTYNEAEALRDRRAMGCLYPTGLCACPAEPLRYEGCLAPDRGTTDV